MHNTGTCLGDKTPWFEETLTSFNVGSSGIYLDDQILPPLLASKDVERTHVHLVIENDDNISYFNYKSFQMLNFHPLSITKEEKIFFEAGMFKLWSVHRI